MSNFKIPNQTPDLHLKPNKPVSGSGFTCEILVWEAEKEVLMEVEADLLETYFQALKIKVKEEIPTLMTFANFLGEAETYMAQNNIKYSSAIRTQYARAIHDEFIAALDNMIEYDKDEGCIYLSPYIYSLEYGDFYRPAVGFLSTCLTAWAEEIEEDLKNI